MRRAGEYEFAVGDDADGRAFEALLDGTLMRVLRTADFTTRARRKLLLNAVANPITALTLQRQAGSAATTSRRCAFFLERPPMSAAPTARSLRPRGRADAGDAADLSARRRHLDVFRSGRRTAFEADALTGAIVAAGERHRADAAQRPLLTLLRATSDGLRDAAQAERR